MTEISLGSVLTMAFLFPGFLFGLLIARYFSGWYLIEKLFRTKDETVSFTKLRSFQIGWRTIYIAARQKSFNRKAGFVKVGAAEKGVYLKFIFPFSMLLYPTNLPWEEIDIQKELASEDYEVVIKKIPKVRIVLSLELGNELISHRS